MRSKRGIRAGAAVRCKCMGIQIDLNADADLHTPPKRTDTVGHGQSIREATGDARYREGRAEAATQWVNAEHAAEEVPRGLGDGETWEAAGEGEK
jgi:hypothetical protein